MTAARSSQVDLNVAKYYHCVSRVVRKAFLCGEDQDTGENFNHRKLWLVERIKFLATIFAIDVAAYAILSNHYHLVLKVLDELVAQWSDNEVIRRVRLLCPGCGQNIESWSEPERQQFLATWRERLSSISWFMAKLNEYIARRANKEDGCKGRFWEGRFRSQALLDEGALLSCMSYVDLNPVRAGLADGLDDSSWTSIQQRIREAAVALGQEESTSSAPVEAPTQPAGPALGSCPVLAPLTDDQPGRSEPLPVSLLQYVQLVEWTGRALRDDSKRQISAGPSRLLAQCGLDPTSWLDSVQRFGSAGVFVGHPDRLKQQADRLGRRWLKGQRQAARSYAQAA